MGRVWKSGGCILPPNSEFELSTYLGFIRWERLVKRRRRRWIGGYEMCTVELLSLGVIIILGLVSGGRFRFNSYYLLHACSPSLESAGCQIMISSVCLRQVVTGVCS